MKADDRLIKTEPASSGAVQPASSPLRADERLEDVEMTPAGQAVAIPTAAPARRQRMGWVRNLLRNPKARLGLGIVIFFALVAIFAPVIAPGPTSTGARRIVSTPMKAPSPIVVGCLRTPS